MRVCGEMGTGGRVMPRRPNTTPLTAEQRDLAASCYPLACQLSNRAAACRGGTLAADLAYDGAVDGLLWAARKYDPALGCRFVTLCHGVVEAAASRAPANRRRRPDPFSDFPGEVWDRPDPRSVEDAGVLPEEVSAGMAALPPDRRAVVESYFGLNGREQRTQKQIAAEFAVCRGRVNQIVFESLYRLGRRLTGHGGRAASPVGATGGRVARVRKDRGQSQAAFAADLGLSRAAVNAVERGLYPPGPKFRAAVKRVCGVDL